MKWEKKYANHLLKSRFQVKVYIYFLQEFKKKHRNLDWVFRHRVFKKSKNDTARCSKEKKKNRSLMMQSHLLWLKAFFGWCSIFSTTKPNSICVREIKWEGTQDLFYSRDSTILYCNINPQFFLTCRTINLTDFLTLFSHEIPQRKSTFLV